MWSFDLSRDAGLNPEVYPCNWDENYFCSYTGSSCATALVSALAMKLLATRDIIPPFSPPDSLYSLLAHTANDLGAPGYDKDNGWGRINAYRAMIAISHGDANGDFEVNVSDAIYIANYVFQGGPPPIPHWSVGDANCDGSVNNSDAVWIINNVFTSGPPPPVCYLNLPE
ncbi:MAG TPA: hypothetical protein ENO22_10540 [candidate division Zixibacteria bacterium]|nr:hypothetical protein [candidate division Zixibacteria bacterium]